jgi:hypothetical protein
MENNLFNRLRNIFSSNPTEENLITLNYTHEDFITLLKPFDIGQNKKRLGPNEDGGYVLSEFLYENCSALFTYGVGHDTRFEEEFVRTYNKPAYLFDHTLGWTDEFERDGMKFIPEGLGSAENCKDIFEHIQKFNVTEPIFLKVDVEGAEWQYFREVDVKKMKDMVMGFVVEIHWLDSLAHREYLADIFNRLGAYFVLNHVHANSWGYNWEHNGMSIPSILELSFVNRKYITKAEIDNSNYPVAGLDHSNNPNVPDVQLDFLKSV